MAGSKAKTTSPPVKSASKTKGLPAARVQNVCVYCGSGPGTNPAYTEAARTLGRTLAEAGMGLVYGGGGLGLMGEVARATLAQGGRVTGIIPEFLTGREHALKDVQEMIVTPDMHTRKQLMFERSDAFVALPGGIGTLEELVEQLTWSQLGRHKKPIVLANIDGYWSPFVELLAHMKADQFIRNGMDVSFPIVNKAELIVPAILAHGAPTADAAADAAILAKF